MARTVAVVCLLAVLAAPVLAEEEKPPARKVIEGVAPMTGRDAMVKGLTRILRVTMDPKLSEEYLFGISGTAFLATVCANNCNCRDFRELYLAINPTLKALGVEYEYFEGKDAAIWDRIRASIDAGIPVTAWGLFGDGRLLLSMGARSVVPWVGGRIGYLSQSLDVAELPNNLGADIIMAFDDCPPSVDPAMLNESRRRTAAERSGPGSAGSRRPDPRHSP